MRGPAVFVIFCLCATGLTTTGSFTAPTARLANLLPKAGAAFGEKWLAGQNATEDPAFFHVTDVSASEFRAQIAKALQAEWKQLPDGTWELIRTPQFLRERQRISLERRTETLEKAIAASKESYLGNNANLPADLLLLYNAIWSIPAEDSAALARGQIEEYATQPNPLQRRLRISPRPNFELVRKALLEQYARDNSPTAQLIRTSSWQNAEVFVRVTFPYTGGLYVCNAVLALDGRILRTATIPYVLDSRGTRTVYTPPSSAPLEKPTPGPFFDLVFSSSLALPSALISADQGRVYPPLQMSSLVSGAWTRPLSPALKALFDDPETNEFTGLPFEPGLKTLAQSTNRDLVVSFQDISFYLACIYSQNYPATTTEFANWAATCGLILREESNWLVAVTGEPDILASLRVDRPALKDFLKDLKRENVPLATRQSFFNRMKMTQEGWLTIALSSALNKSEADILMENGADRWSAHRLAATIGMPGPGQNEVRVNIATAAAPLKGAFQNYLLLNKPLLGIVDERSPLNSFIPLAENRDRAPALIGTAIATEWINEPLRSDSTLNLSLTNDSFYRVKLKNPEATADLIFDQVAVLIYGIPGFEAPVSATIESITPLTQRSGNISITAYGRDYPLTSLRLDFVPGPTQTLAQFISANQARLIQIAQEIATSRRNQPTETDQPNQPPN